MQQTIDYDPLEALAEAGDLHLAGGRYDEARRCFEEVLTRRADHARALSGLDMLESRGHSAPPVAPESEELVVGAPPSLESEIVSLVRDRKYEEALESLFRAREISQGDPAVARSIRHVKKHLERRYRRSLGDLDGVPRLEAAVPDDGDVAIIAGWVDGIGTYGDILDISRLGRFRTLRALSRLVESGVIATHEDSAPTIVAKRDRMFSSAPPAPTPVPAALKHEGSKHEETKHEETAPTERPSALALPSVQQSLSPRRRSFRVPLLIALVPAAALLGWVLAAPATAPLPMTQNAPVAAAAAPTTPRVSAPVQRAELELHTEPAGAMAYLGDRQLGPTPINIELLGEDALAGRVLDLRFELEGHEPRTLEQTLPEGGLTVATTLAPVRVEPPRRRRSRMRARMRAETPEPAAQLGQLRGYKAEPY